MSWRRRGVLVPAGGEPASFQAPSYPAPDRTVALWLVLLLAAVYLLIFSGRFHSIDEVSSVALAGSIATQGQAHTDQIPWSQDWPLPQGTWGLDGHLYSKKGIGLSLIVAPLVLVARQLPSVGVVGMVMLTNLLVTALTGGLLYALVRRLGYGRSAGVFVALTWGLATLAPVYSKTLFNSPAVALGFVACLLLLLPPSAAVPALFINARLFLAGALLGWVVLTRPENALVVPLFAGLLFFTTPGSGRVRLARLIVFGLPLAATAGFLLWFNWTRFGNPLDFGYDLGVEAGGNPVTGLLGILFSPGRSIFLYMPVLVPALIGFAALLRSPSRRPISLLVVGITAVYLLFFAAAIDWWGGWNWGIRYLLPLLPLWCLGLAPLWEQRPRRPLLVGAAALSGLVQVGGALVDFNRPLVEALNANIDLEAQLWSFTDSQIVAHFARLPHTGEWDVVWAATGAWWLAVVAIALTAATIAGLRRGLGGRPSAAWAAAAGAGLLLLASLNQVHAYDDPFWRTHRAELEPLADRLEAAPAGSLLIFEMLSYRDYFDRAQTWLNVDKSGAPHVQLVQQATVDDHEQALLELALRDATIIYLALQGTPPATGSSWVERWVSERAAFLSEEWIGETRLTRFVSSPGGSGVGLGPVSSLGEQVELLSPGLARVEEYLVVTLPWRARELLDRDLRVFVQLLGPDGQVVSQQDRDPQSGFAPTTSWVPGEVVIDRYALPVPDDGGPFRLIVGLYDPATGVRLPAGESDFVDLGEVAP